MPAPLTPVPGKAELITEIAALNAQKAANTGAISTLTDANTQIDAQLAYAATSLEQMRLLTQLQTPGSFSVTPNAGTTNTVAATNTEPSRYDVYVIERATDAAFTVDFTTILSGAFSASVTDNDVTLVPGAQYFYRAYFTATVLDNSEYATDNCIALA